MKEIQSDGKNKYVSGFRVMNPRDNPEAWVLSKRPSKVVERLPVDAHLLETIAEAKDYFAARGAIGVSFTEERYQSPYPNGVVFINRASFNPNWDLSSCPPTNLFFTSYFFQDGAKFARSTDKIQGSSWHFALMSKRWLDEVAASLGAGVDLKKRNGF